MNNVGRFTKIISIISLLIATLVTILAFSKLPPLLPLFNKLPWGYARLGQKPFIFLPIGISLCILIINTILAKQLLEKSPLLARFLYLSACAICLFTTIFILKVIQLTL